MSRYLKRMVPQNVMPAHGQDVELGERDPVPIIARKIPAQYVVGPEALVNNFLPPWNKPGYWSIPIDIETAFIPLSFYETPYLVLSRVTPDGYISIISGISYEVTCMTQYDFFDFYVYRNGDLLSSWEDMLIDPANPNPAHRFAQGGHLREIPYYGRIDGAETFTIKVKAKGQEPFTHTPMDPLICAMRMCIHGWQTQEDSTREGKGRLAQNGELMDYHRKFANGDMDPMRNLYNGIPRPQ